MSPSHPLVPELRTSVSGCERESKLPLLSIQVTVYPMAGLSLGFAYHHVAADLRTFNNFIMMWSSLCRDSNSHSHPHPVSLPIKTLPTFNRTVIVGRDGLEEVFLNKWFEKCCKEEEVAIGSETEEAADLSSDMVRATFVVDPTHMDRIQKWIVTQCLKKNQAQPVHLSPYVLTCSFVWVCLVRSLFQERYHFGCQDPIYFGFNAGGINRLGYRLPASHFGNCVGFGRAVAFKEELLGEDGVVVAANALGNTIKTLDKALFLEADRWILDWAGMVGSDTHVVVSGSPKVDLYDTYFGWVGQ